MARCSARGCRSRRSGTYRRAPIRRTCCSTASAPPASSTPWSTARSCPRASGAPAPWRGRGGGCPRARGGGGGGAPRRRGPPGGGRRGRGRPLPPAGSEPLPAAPDSITVDVLNGTGTTGLAGQVADLIRAQGFGVGTVGNEPGTVSQTLVRFGPAVQEQARTVAASVPGAELQPSDSIGNAVQLVLGPGYTGVVPVQLGAPVVPEPPVAAETSAAAEEPTATAPPCS